MIRLNNPQYFHFLQRADALRHSRSLCDAVISVDDHTFHAHRVVLACASRTLAHLMSQDQDGPVQCTLEHLSSHTFRQLLDFIYSETLEVTEEDLRLLLLAAQKLQMRGLEEQCKSLLNRFQTEGKNKSAELIKPETEGGRKVKEEQSNPPHKQTHGCTTEEKSTSDSSSSSPQKLSLSAAVAQRQRDSVITSSYRPFSPWTFPAHMWSSVSTLRQIAHNYSLMSAHSVSDSFTCPLSMPSHRVLLSSAFQSPAQASVLSYSHLHSHYSTNTGPLRAGGLLRQGLLKRRKHRVLSQDSRSCRTSHMDVAKADTGRDCQHCSAQPQGSTVCRFCGRDMTKPGIRAHETERRLDKPYQCNHCSKRFSLKHQLDTHNRVHTGEKPFECRLCGQRSRDYSAMIKHLRTHGGAAPYQCTVCLEYCSSLVAMQRHVKSHALHEFPTDWSIGSTYMYRSHI
ncbi:zinc finger and BTB domain-containing protein 16-A [Periophthalmus magnuspinnatus]|uniref:zinc finger and BTB domain-containing protein 16-A n=1 Tax=Periophthalmus magnuspinnatus TaxID=409849 RepID=UPI00145C0090|nr:zinc finger and BTB domain-containing protein 16-A [Periophthalmus magnuspinnatus]